MATRVWIGTDGDWEGVSGTFSNWGGTQPAAGDVLIVPDGAAALTTNVDRTGDTGGLGLDLNGFHVSAKCTNDIGSSGTPMKLVAEIMDIKGSGTTYFHSQHATVGSYTGKCVVSSSNLIDAAVITGSNWGAQATIQRLDALRGGVSLGTTDANYPEINISMNDGAAGGSVGVGQSNVTLLSTCNGVDLLSTDGGAGTITLSCDFTTAVLGGGTITYDFAGNGGTAYVCGGTLLYNTLTADGAIARAVLLGGTLDSTRTAGHKTITVLRNFPLGNLVTNSDLHVGTDIGGV